jgi:hypothetical protein
MVAGQDLAKYLLDILCKITFPTPCLSWCKSVFCVCVLSVWTHSFAADKFFWPYSNVHLFSLLYYSVDSHVKSVINCV